MTTSRKYAVLLQPLTGPAVGRMRNLYAYAPLESTPATEKADAELLQKGWAVRDADYDGALTPSGDAYRMDDGGPVLLDERGLVRGCWRLRASGTVTEEAHAS